MDIGGRLRRACRPRHHGAMPAMSAPGKWPRLGWRLAREMERQELLDEAPASAALAGNLTDLRRANSWFGGRALVGRYLQPRLRVLPRGSRVTLLDIGTGGRRSPGRLPHVGCRNRAPSRGRRCGPQRRRHRNDGSLA